MYIWKCITMYTLKTFQSQYVDLHGDRSIVFKIKFNQATDNSYFNCSNSSYCIIWDRKQNLLYRRVCSDVGLKSTYMYMYMPRLDVDTDTHVCF